MKSKIPFFLRAEYQEYCQDCIEAGEKPLWNFRDYIDVVYYYEYLDNL